MKIHWRTILFFGTLLLAVMPIFSLSLWEEVWVAVYWPALFVLELYLVTWPWRTVPLRLVLGAFLLGVGPVMGTVLLVQIPLVSLLDYAYSVHYFFADVMGKNVDVSVILVAPLTEELLKILPLAIVLVVGPLRHLRYTAGPLDFAVLGAALGGGFQFMETVWQGIVSVDLHSNARIGEHISPHLGPFYLLPTLARPEWSTIAWFGHAGVTASVALALGLALRLALRNRWWWLLPLATGGLITFEHFLSNLGEPPVLWLQLLALADLNGVLSSVWFVAGTVWAAFISARIFRRYRAVDTEAVFGLQEIVRATVIHPTAFLGTIPLALLLLRLSRAVAFGLDWLGHRRNRPHATALSLYGLRQTALALREGLLSKQPAPERAAWQD